MSDILKMSQYHKGKDRSIRLDIECLSKKELKGWTIGKHIKSGSYGDVFVVCNEKNNCTERVLKMIPFIDPGVDEDFKKEVDMLALTSKHDVSPKLYDSWICDHVKVTMGKYEFEVSVGFILMEMWDSDLENAGDIKIDPMVYLDLTSRLIKFNKDTGIFNPDIRKPNILMKVGDGGVVKKLTIGDWGWTRPEKEKGNVDEYSAMYKQYGGGGNRKRRRPAARKQPAKKSKMYIY
jgi:hypothetical protein